RRQGQFRAALEALKRGHELGSQRPGWSEPSARWVRECEQLVALDEKLPALLKGEAQPADAPERLALAALCLRYKHCNGAAARFYADAFADQPTLADDPRSGHRYNAACAAALAALGKGQDADRLDDAERAALRHQAHAWLAADLAVWTKQIDSNTAQARE